MLLAVIHGIVAWSTTEAILLTFVISQYGLVVVQTSCCMGQSELFGRVTLGNYIVLVSMPKRPLEIVLAYIRFASMFSLLFLRKTARKS